MRVSKFVAVLSVCALAACSKSESSGQSSTPTSPTPVATTPVVHTIGISGNSSFSQRGETAQFRATAFLSNGATEDRTASVSWTSDNNAVATVNSQGVVTAQGEGAATITAAQSGISGTQGVAVRLGAAPPSTGSGTVSRTPDPPAGQRLPLPANAQALIEQIASARMDLLVQQSCPRGLKYVRNPWLDYMVDELRKRDTRWGYNAKPNRTAADNSGVPVEVAGDEITYHFGAGADEGSQDVYPIDILLGHCGPTPSLTFRVFTGEEPVRWTGAGRF